MGIAPFLLAVSRNVSLGDIHASDESCLAVDDTQFAVVPVVHLARESREQDRHERFDGNSGIAHALKEVVSNVPASYIIIYYSNFNPLLSLVDKDIGKNTSQCIILEDIGVEMYTLLGCADVVEERIEERISIGENIDVVVFKRQRPVLRGKKLYESLVLLGNNKVFLYGEFEHRTFREQVKTVLTDKFLLPRVLSEKEI